MAQGAPVVTDTRYFQGRVGWAIEFPFRVEVRLGLRGPNAAPATTDPAAFHAGDPVLLDLLGGVAPEAAERLNMEGGGRDDRACRHGGDLLLVTRAEVLSLGPWAAERGASGLWAYRLPDVPYALVTRGGRETRLAFETPEDVLTLPALENDHDG